MTAIIFPVNQYLDGKDYIQSTTANLDNIIQNLR